MPKQKHRSTDSLKRHIEAYGFEDFVSAARIQVKLLDPGSVDRIILEYLLKNAIGAANAKCWNSIAAHLDEMESRPITKKRFQNNLLKKSRRNTYFIGSGIGGYFIIETAMDVAITREFYETRIRQETQHLETLEYLAEQCGLIPFPLPGESGRELPREDESQVVLPS